MSRNFTTTKVLWFTTGLLTLFVAAAGIITPAIYGSVVAPDILPGVLAQDLMSLLAAVTVIILAVRTKEEHKISAIIITGLLGYFFYAYGIYVIEQIYTGFYLLYMAIFGLAFYSIVSTLAGLQAGKMKISLPGRIRKISTGFLLLNPVIFYPLWISQLIPLMRSGEKLEYLFSIYILDLCFIMPAFLIVAYKLLKKDNFGFLVTPALFVLGFTLLFPLALVEIGMQISQQSADLASLGLFLVLSVTFFILALLYIRRIKITTAEV